MKIKIIIFACTILLLPLSVSAHGLERQIPNITLNGFNFAFTSTPQFPVINRETHLAFSFENKLPQQFAIKINGQIIKLSKELNGFDAHYIFTKAGRFPLTFIINKQEFPSKISITISDLGVAGWWRIIFLIIAFILIMLGILSEKRQINKLKKLNN